MRKLILILAIAAGVPAIAQNADHNFDVAKNLDVFTAIYKNLDLMYVDSLNADDVVGNGINGMLRSLDPYTTYYPESKMEELKQLYTGKFAGIGSMIRYNPTLKYTLIEEPRKGMPADLVGLKKGDIILSINDSSMYNRETEYVSSRLRGDAGTSFMLKIKRPSTGKQMDIKMTRAVIQEPSVPYFGMRANGIGYINLSAFTQGCAKDVRRAFVELKSKGMKSLVLDLRNNGGGSEQEAVDIVNLFVPKDVLIVSNRGKLKKVNADYKTTAEPIDTVMPIVVLVNDASASASEITSGSLQDLDRAVILGTRTYGKGLVQMTVDLPYNGSLKLTTNKYYIPSGRCIQAINYKHANGGYVEHVPDSLTKEFRTLHGRVVRDGGGIQPDVEVTPDTIPNIAVYLQLFDSTNVMLNYEIDYVAKHKSIAPASKFEINDKEYEDFKQRVLQSGFTYDRESEKYIKELIKLAKFEGYYEDTKAEFDNLTKKLSHNIAKDLDFNKTAIKQMLTRDIVTSYYYQEGAIENSLNYDKQMDKAMNLLGDPQEYNKILQPAKDIENNNN